MVVYRESGRKYLRLHEPLFLLRLQVYLVYLNELNKMQASMIGQLPDECLRAESREVLYFLNNIAIKKSDNPDELNICNNYFKFGIVYAINDRTMRHSGYKAHQRVIQKLIENEYKTIYVITFVGYLCHFIIINNLIIL